MKQNERLLVYAVTGFLAVILIIAVLFGNDPKSDATKGNGSPQGLDELLGQGSPGQGSSGQGLPAGGRSAENGGNPLATKPGDLAETLSGLARPGPAASEQPLVARPQLAADLVARALGQSRRDRNVRFVRAKNGDSLELLVRRWCGARDPHLDEAKRLNEELVVLKVGQEVAVPWIDDELLVAAIEAQQPRTLLADAGAVLADAGAVLNGGGNAVPAAAGRGPDFELPGAGSVPTAAGAAATTTHTVVSGDALWKIASSTYGARNAPRMIEEIKRLNPGLDPDVLKLGQKIKLPPKPE